MSFFQQSMLTSLNSSSHFDEQQWVRQVRQTLDDEIEEEVEAPVTIFGAPRSLMLTKPEFYIPQQVAIGPYHHLKPDLYDMERYKVSAAKRHQKELQNDLKFKHLVDHIIKYELRIRASYHRPLNFGCETLCWMMAVDAAFLFEFLQVCGIREGKVLTKQPSRLSHLVGLLGNKTAHSAIMRDIMMLENQIPLFVVRMLVEFQVSSLECPDELLLHMLTSLSKEISPFKMVVEESQQIEIKDCVHFLDFLYRFIVPKLDITIDITEVNENEGENEKDDDEHPLAKPGYLKQCCNEIWNVLSKLEKGPIEWIKRILFSKPLKFLVKLPWTIVTKIPIINMVKTPVEQMFRSMSKEKEKDEDGEEGSNSKKIENVHPVLEEIKIPSVTQLLEAGVKFLPTNEGIMKIDFDENTRSFYMPIITLDVNSEVVLRNLVAYEAASSSILVLGRYTELMNGIIDTDEDAKFLCQNGIITNHLKSEKEVANLWNGMSKSIRLTKVTCFDEVIRNVNKYYDGRWNVKFARFMKNYVFGSWKILTFLAAIMMLLLMTLQAFCQVYSCARVLPIKGLEPFGTTG